MKQALQHLLCTVLCLCLLLGGTQAYAAKPDQEKTLHISTAEEFLAFAENCRLDSYSQGLSVYLESDLDLGNASLAGIPIFCGHFFGGHHTISGVVIDAAGSSQGLFRYLTGDGIIQDLSVRGKIRPQGSRSCVGGLVGSNDGRILACHFNGTVTGNNQVGGLAGTSSVTGIIENCSAEGTIKGTHFTGGIVGENHGLVRNCTNSATVNITSDHDAVDLENITVDTITGTEAASTVTDTGGITGLNSGVLRKCSNQATVGYPHLGYNVGGIAGRQSGYISSCSNTGKIFGRKEVGGITGQMEPMFEITYTRDTLQILQGQLNTASSMAGRAVENAASAAAPLENQMSALKGHSQDAAKAVEHLLTLGPDADPDEILAAQNALNSSLGSLHGAMGGIASSAQESSENTKKDLQALSDQLQAVANTLGNASEHLGVRISDASDQDTPANQTGKIELCSNIGPVSGDLNIGGAVGAVVWENDMDPESDLRFSGKSSLNLDGNVRAVIRSCSNKGSVSARKQHAGGLVGWLPIGLVKDCINTGSLAMSGAELAGGIAGESTGFIRNCQVKSELAGSSCIGGIAGSGTVVTDCRSMTDILHCEEKSGAVLGIKGESRQEVENPISGNLYLITGEDLGGIDGISYEGLAQPAGSAEFFALEDLDAAFRHATVTFLFEDGHAESRTVEPGGTLWEEDLPAVPEREGYLGSWETERDNGMSEIYFDRVFEPHYAPCQTVIQSEQLRRNGKPVLLAQGLLASEDKFSLGVLNNLPVIPASCTVVESWRMPDLEAGQTITLRYAIPRELPLKRLQILVRDASSTWEEVSFTENGSYLVFPAEPGSDAFCVVLKPGRISWESVVVGIVCTLAGLFWIFHRGRRQTLLRRRSRQKRKQH